MVNTFARTLLASARRDAPRAGALAVAFALVACACAAPVEAPVADTSAQADTTGGDEQVAVSVGISEDHWCTTLAGAEMCRSTCKGHCVTDGEEVCCLPGKYLIERTLY